MPDMRRVEDLVNQYVSCWAPHRPSYSGVYEDNDLGCEHLQVFRNGFRIETFTHHELSQLSILLTRSLRGQINRDHKLLWSWCAYLPTVLRNHVPLFTDRDWVGGFCSLVNLLLAGSRRYPAGPDYVLFRQESLRYVNSHLLEVCSSRHLMAGCLAFAVLEGLLRRKTSAYVRADGTVAQAFSVVEPSGKTVPFTPGRGRLNRVNVALRLFEQRVTSDRNRACPYLADLKSEIGSLYTSTDVYDLIDSWRNELLHGEQYWIDRVPIVLNLICILTTDEIEPVVHDAELCNFTTHLDWMARTRALTAIRAPWEMFPPDIT